MIEAFLIPFFLLVAIGLAVWGYLHNKKRRQALQDWAELSGWTYEEKDRALHLGYERFEPFRKGSGRMCTSIMEGKLSGRPARIFQYQYTIQSDKSSTTYYFRVVHVTTKRKAPDLIIKKEHFGHKIFDALGGEDIDFESDEFSRRFWVRCKDRAFAYRVITPPMMEFLLQRPKAMWQWSGNDLLLVRSDTLKVGNLQQVLTEMEGWLAHLPRPSA